MNESCGEVFLVGAGPGDPDLITVKGRRLLRRAGVVIYDRLIGTELLSECRPDAVLIDVGKSPDSPSVEQAQIDQLLIEHAQQGSIVVRLKGGDPFLFGRGSEELAACRAAGVDCTVVPGISSALAAPASVGIPVTMRGSARSVVVLTGQSSPDFDYQIDFPAIACVDTVVLLMGRRVLRQFAKSLIEAGREPELPAACIANATTDSQRHVIGNLGNIADLADAAGLQNPVVSIFGEVAGVAIDN